MGAGALRGPPLWARGLDFAANSIAGSVGIGNFRFAMYLLPIAVWQLLNEPLETSAENAALSALLFTKTARAAASLPETLGSEPSDAAIPSAAIGQLR